VGDKTGEGFLDILIPLYQQSDSIVFINPRVSLRDEGEVEANLGVGYRRKLPDKDIILGGNLFIDSRESKYNNRFTQYGAGFEILSNRIDARVNYYKPEDKYELIGSFNTEEAAVDVDRSVSRRTTSSSSQNSRITRIQSTGSNADPAFRGENIVVEGQRTITTTATDKTTRTDVTTTTTTKKTTTTTRRLFEQFEGALEGFDAEIGYLLPLSGHAPEVRLFGGYYDFDRRLSNQEDIKGLKGRIEVRTGPYFTFDAEVFEDDKLNDTKYFVGARLHIPLKRKGGKKLFSDLKQSFKSFRQRPVESRLTEQIIRDVRVQTEESDFTENEKQREIDRVTDIDVRSVTQTLVSKETSTSQSTTRRATVVLSEAGEDITVTHVNSNNGGAGDNDGSIESPHTTITDADGTAASIILIHSDSTFTDQSITLGDDQRLLGEGGGVSHQINTDQLGTIDLPDANGSDGATPILSQTGGGTSISINSSNVEVANVRINGGTSGIVATGPADNIHINNVSITDVSGTGISLGSGGPISSANTFNNIDITNTGGTAVELVNVASSARIRGDDISIVNAQRGLAISGALTGAQFVFNNTAISTNGGNGVDIEIGAGNTARVDFSDNLNIETDTGTGFNVTGGALVTVTGTGNAIEAAGGTAINFQDAAIGVNGLTFRTVSSSDAVNGIILNNTGGSGGLTITGDGIGAANGSGGTIQNSSGAAVVLNRTGDFDFSSLNVFNPTGDGYDMDDITGFNFVRGTRVTGLDTFEDGIDWLGDVDGAASLTVSSSQFVGGGGMAGFNRGITLETDTNAYNATLTINDIDGVSGDSVFEELDGDALVVTSGSSNGGGTVNVNVQDTLFRNADASGDNGVDLVALGDSTLNVVFNDNTLNNVGTVAGGGVVGINVFQNAAADAEFFGNDIDNIALQTGFRFDIAQDVGGGSVDIQVNDNEIDGVGDSSIYFRVRDDSPDVDVQINNNMIGTTTRVGTNTVDPGVKPPSSILVDYSGAAQIELEIRDNNIFANTDTQIGGLSFVGVVTILSGITTLGQTAHVDANVTGNLIDNSGTMLRFEADTFADTTLSLNLNDNTFAGTGSGGDIDLFHDVPGCGGCSGTATGSLFELVEVGTVSARNGGAAVVFTTGTAPVNIPGPVPTPDF